MPMLGTFTGFEPGVAMCELEILCLYLTLTTNRGFVPRNPNAKPIRWGTCKKDIGNIKMTANRI